MTSSIPRPNLATARTSRGPFARLGVIAAGCLLLAACGSSTAASTSAPTASPTGSGSGSAAFAAYRQCLQQHGASLPTSGAGGNSAGTTSSAANTAARQAYASLRPAGGFGGTGGAISASALAAFRSCMSDHGVNVPTTTPAPSASRTGGTSGAGGVLAGLSRNDPTVAKALATCRVLLPTRTPTGSATTPAG